MSAAEDQLGPLPDSDWTGGTLAYTAEQMRAYALQERAAEREWCAMKLQVTRADVSLAAGEMSAQEWRTCAAVLRWMQARIRGANARLPRPLQREQD